MILDHIIAAKLEQLVQEKQVTPLASLVSQLENSFLPTPYSFIAAIRQNPGLAIIAEVKKASPSKGLIREEFEPVLIAKEYARQQVAAISVLTETKYFQGSAEYLQAIRQAVSLPLLCKDFIVDPYQVYQARLLGADCILLIVAALSTKQLKHLYQLARNLGLDCLVEVHNLEELKIALDIGADLIGINNRDLKTFNVSLSVTENLIEHIPPQKTVISESGIHTREDFGRLEKLAVDGVLIGESLMRAPSIAAKLLELTGGFDGAS